MTQHMGYLVDLSSVKFDETTTASWIHAMPLGTYSHPVYGDVAITPERAQRFAENVNNRVRQIDLDIDYDHKAKTDEAAGWIKKAEARADGVWVFVEWTKDAYKKIKDKAYRYFSPEFVDVWKHPKTSMQYQDVLFGGGITNRPYFKDILPINMSEVFAEQQQEGRGMDEATRKELAKLHGLPEDASEEQILGAARVLAQQKADREKAEADAAAAAGGAPAGGAPATDPPAVPIAAGEVDPAIKQLSESNPAVASLLKKFEEQSAAIGMLVQANKIGAANQILDKQGKFALTPVAKEGLRQIFAEVPMQFSDKLADVIKLFTEGKGLVELDERGGIKSGTARSDEPVAHAAQKAYDDAVEVKVKGGMSYADAAVAVSQEMPQLFNEYAAEAVSFVTKD